MARVVASQPSIRFALCPLPQSRLAVSPTKGKLHNLGDCLTRHLASFCAGGYATCLVWAAKRHVRARPSKRTVVASASSLSSPYSRESAWPKVWILDRDGVINEDVGRPGVVSPECFHLIPGAADAIRLLKVAGCQVIVATNQTSIRKDLLSHKGLAMIHKRMDEKLLEYGTSVDHVLIATEPPRLKPSPEMLLEALQITDLPAADALMIGDSWTDMEAAAAAGVRGVLVTSSLHGDAAKQRLHAGETFNGNTVLIYDDLKKAVMSELQEALAAAKSKLQRLESADAACHLPQEAVQSQLQASPKPAGSRKW